MKAAVLKSFGSPLVLETLADPVLGTGEVIVDVAATRVLPYANEVFSGVRNYSLDLPLVPGPGAIGRVRALGDSAVIRPAVSSLSPLSTKLIGSGFDLREDSECRP